MGVLGTNLNMRDATKIVIIEVVDNNDCYEIAHVYGDNEDFDVLCRFPLNMPMHFSNKAVNYHLQRISSGLPIYTCQISHKKDIMSMEEGIKRILGATKPWTREV